MRHRHRRLDENELGWPDGMHPGWPRRPRPPGDPGLHQAKEVGPEARRDPRVRPGWPGWPRPPGDPGSHQTHHGEHATPSSAARRPGGPGSERRTEPTPHPLGGKLNRSEAGPRGTGPRIHLPAQRLYGTRCLTKKQLRLPSFFGLKIGTTRLRACLRPSLRKGHRK